MFESRTDGATLRATGLGLLVAVMAFISVSISAREYIYSDFLLHDDGLWVSRALLGEGGSLAGYPLARPPLNIAGSFGSILLVKGLFVLPFALSCGTAAALLYWLTGLPWLSSLSALAIGTYPVSVDQLFYIIGTHPTIGAWLTLSALGVFCLSWGLPDGQYRIGLGLCSLLVLLANLSSATMVLMSLAPLLWLAAVSAIKRRGWRRSLVGLAILGLPLVVQAWRGIGDYGYAADPGRIVVSSSNVVASLLRALEFAFRPFDADNAWLWAGYLGSFLFLFLGLSVAWHQSRRGASRREVAFSEARVLSLMLLLSGALAFGPTSIVAPAFYRSRYAVAPLLLTSLAVVVLLLPLLRHRERLPRLLLSISLLCLTGVNLTRGRELLEEQYGAYLPTHEEISSLVERESQSWSDDAQVVIALRPGRANTTHGSSPWSRWYLRYLSRRPRILGLVDTEANLAGRLSGAAEGGGSPGASGEVAFGLRSLGLFANRPLYLYREATDGGGFRQSDVAFLAGVQSMFIAPFGGRPKDAAQRALTIFDESCSMPAEDPFVWFTDRVWVEVEAQFAPDGGRAESWSFLGKDEVTVQVEVPENSLFAIRFDLLSSGALVSGRGATRTYPPMPLTSPPIAIYQTRMGFNILGLGPTRPLWRVDEKGSGVEIRLFGREGCKVLLLADGRVLGFLDSKVASGTWALGRGIQERYWAGSITNWEVQYAK